MTKELQAEIESTLLRNLAILKAEATRNGDTLSTVEVACLGAVEAMLRACAANLAQMLAPRMKAVPHA